MDFTLYRNHLRVVMERTDAALAATGYPCVVFGSGPLLYAFQDDQSYPFRPNPHFLYWVPLTEHPDAFVVYTPGKRPLLCYPAPRDFWHMAPQAPDPVWADAFDLVACTTPADALRHLPAAAAYVGPDHGLGDWRATAVNPQPLLDHLHYGRACKTPYEVECIRQASRMAAAGHQAAADAFAQGASEFDILLRYCAAVGQTPRQQPYGAIVGLNEHAAILHYQRTDSEPPDRSFSLLIDAGASHCGYGADVTRTHANGGGGLFHDLLPAMNALQQELCARLRPGVDFRDLHREAMAMIARLLARSGILRCSDEAALAAGLVRPFFPHGLGHLLGLQVHDVGGFQADSAGTLIPRPEDAPFLRLTRRLDAGMVLTVEPGLYIIDSLLQEVRAGAGSRLVDWQAVEALRPYGGIRIEDNVLVTDDGYRNLTREALPQAGSAVTL